MPLTDTELAAFAEKIAQSQQARTQIGPEAQMPLKWVVAGAAFLVVTTFSAASFINGIQQNTQNVINIQYMREWGKEAERLNPNWHTPDPKKVFEDSR